MVISNGEIPVLPPDVLPNPFGQLGVPLSDSELRETAYEVLVGSCWSTGGKPLTYIPQSPRRTAERSPSMSFSSPSLSLQRSLLSKAASKVKKALGLKKKEKDPNSLGQDPVGSSRSKKPVTASELCWKKFWRNESGENISYDNYPRFFQDNWWRENLNHY